MPTRLSFPCPPCHCPDAGAARYESNVFGHYASCPRRELRLPNVHDTRALDGLWVWRVTDSDEGTHYTLAATPDDAFAISAPYFDPDAELTTTLVAALTWEELRHERAPGGRSGALVACVARESLQHRRGAQYLAGPRPPGDPYRAPHRGARRLPSR